MSSPACFYFQCNCTLSLNKHKYYFLLFLNSCYRNILRDFRGYCLLCLFCVPCIQPRTVITCHLPCCLIFDDHHQLRVDFSYPKWKYFLFWSLFQQSTSMASHDELNLIKTIGSSMNCIMFHFRHVPNSDTLSITATHSHSHMGSVLFLYIFVIALQTHEKFHPTKALHTGYSEYW
jgi:hypothetical protein